jgi:hypothetical protein
VAEQQRRAAQRCDQALGVEVGERQQPVGAVVHEVPGAAAETEHDDRAEQPVLREGLVADANASMNVASLCAMLLQDVVDATKAAARRPPGPAAAGGR